MRHTFQAMALAISVLSVVSGPATALDFATAAARMKELAIKPETYKEPTPATVAEASYIDLSKAPGLTDGDIAMVAALPKLNLLKLGEPEALKPDRLRVLMAAPGLTRLNLYGAALNDEALAIIATASRLRDIDMRTAKGFSPSGIGQLAKLRQLGYLQLDGTVLGDEGLQPFASHPTLYQFDLTGSKGLTDKVFETFGTMPKLAYLHLQHSGLTLGGAARLKNAAAMKRLRLDGLAVKSGDMPLLASFANLFALSLSETDVDDGLAAVLPKLKTLRELDLRKTKIGDATIAALASNSELVDLNIAETRVTDAPFKNVVWKDLRRINAPGSGVTDSVLPDVVRQPMLEAFYAERTKVTKEGIGRVLATRPANLPKLSITN